MMHGSVVGHLVQAESFRGVCNRLDNVISIIGRDASQQLSRTALGKRLSNIYSYGPRREIRTKKPVDRWKYASHLSV